MERYFLKKEKLVELPQEGIHCLEWDGISGM